MITDRAYGSRAHPPAGRLFIVEGIDGSGKSTQLTLLAEWLKSEGHPVVFSEWKSSAIVKATTSRGKRRRQLTPLSFSLIHATDSTITGCNAKSAPVSQAPGTSSFWSSLQRSRAEAAWSNTFSTW